jgi:hypothetical protein
MAEKRYGWHCEWCDEYFVGPYRESVEREREHRANCRAAPVGARPTTLGKRRPPPAADLPPVDWPEKRYVGCGLGGDKCAQGHYWESPKYRGEVCVQQGVCPFLKEAVID